MNWPSTFILVSIIYIFHIIIIHTIFKEEVLVLTLRFYFSKRLLSVTSNTHSINFDDHVTRTNITRVFNEEFTVCRKLDEIFMHVNVNMCIRPECVHNVGQRWSDVGWFESLTYNLNIILIISQSWTLILCLDRIRWTQSACTSLVCNSLPYIAKRWSSVVSTFIIIGCHLTLTVNSNNTIL